MHVEISDELRKAGVAASTIREALAEYMEAEHRRIIIALTGAKNWDEMCDVKANAIAWVRLDRQLRTAANMAIPEDEDNG